eukprot:Gb_08382 [translate_table: standard]
MTTNNIGRCSKAYRGVQLRRWGKWVAEIRCGRRSRISLGSYFSPEAAARAYDAALLLLRRPHSHPQLNFPDSAYALPNEITSSNLSPKSIRKAAVAVGSAFDRVQPSAATMDSATYDKVASPVRPEIEESTSYSPNCSPPPVALPDLHGVECGREAMEGHENMNEFDTNSIDAALLAPLPTELLDEDPLGLFTDIPVGDQRR